MSKYCKRQISKWISMKRNQVTQYRDLLDLLEFSLEKGKNKINQQNVKAPVSLFSTNAWNRIGFYRFILWRDWSGTFVIINTNVKVIDIVFHNSVCSFILIDDNRLYRFMIKKTHEWTWSSPRNITECILLHKILYRYWIYKKCFKINLKRSIQSFWGILTIH